MRSSVGSAAVATIAAVLALECVAAPVANPGFEDGQPGGPPAGWAGSITRPQPPESPPAVYRASVDSENPRAGHSSARLERVGAPGGEPGFGTIAQSLDATPYQGRRIRFTAAVRVAAPPPDVGLWLRVDRNAGRPGFFDNMANRPITNPEWADYTIEGDVSADAERIVLGLLLVGDGRAWIDDVRLDDLGPAVDASAYLEAALELLRERHINTASADWTAIEGRARAAVDAAAPLQAAHAAIRGVIADLGEPHTFLDAAPPGGGAGPPPAMPDHAMTGGRFGVVRLPGFIGSAEQGASYAARLRDGLASMDAGARVCGWIVDLRDNTGGNMWPMLNGLDPLLGPGPFGAFRAPSGPLSHWVRGEQGIGVGSAALDRAPFFTFASADAPVAVLLGPRTGSSGEMTAIAFAGRERTRSFGAETAGFSTANSTFPLSDGSTLVITTAYARDRTGHEYRGPIAPDERVEPHEAGAAAVRWLEAQSSC